MYQASYYDREQGLTPAEVYAARVHDWHESADRFNLNHARNNSPLRVGYGQWLDEWGSEPSTCPACRATLGIAG